MKLNLLLMLTLLVPAFVSAQQVPDPIVTAATCAGPVPQGATLVSFTRAKADNQIVMVSGVISPAISSSGDVYAANAIAKPTPEQRTGPTPQKQTLAYATLFDAAFSAIVEAEKVWVQGEKQLAASKAAQAAAAATAVQAEKDLAKAH
jgi:hypothetical protein